MIYYVAGIFAVLVVVSLLFIPRRRPAKRELRRLSEDDFLHGIRNLARENRIIERGKGVSLLPMMRYMKKAESVITSKVVSGKPLIEGEKWFYENLYFVKRFADAFDARGFSLLPNSAGGIRILTLARYIVENSEGVLDFERIKSAITTVNNESILTFQEVRALRTALGAAIIEQIYMLSRRLIHYEKMERAAKKRISAENLKSDIYLHFLLKSESRSEILENLTKRGVNIEGVEFNYSMSVVQTTRMAKYLFESLKNLPDILPDEKALSLLIIDRELSENGYYKDMAHDTKLLYLSKIAAISEAINAGELLITKKLINFAEFNGLDPIVVLYNHRRALIKYVRNAYYLKKVKEKSGKCAEYLYIFSVLAGAVGLAAAFYFLLGNLAAALVSVVPNFIISECILNKILSAAVKPRPLPEMNYSKIPAEHSAMIVVSEYITSPAQMKEAIGHLKALKESNSDPNISAALLIDLKPSDSMEDDSDEAITDICRELEDKEGYLIFIRRRKKINNRYRAYERKRGAIMALIKLLMTGYKEDFSYISSQNIVKPEYIIPLDADNLLSVGGAKELINIIAHPANKKYDLIAARSRFNLYSLKTFYAARFRREAAFVNYPNYTSLYYNMFGRDIFCGKGIFRLKAFYNKLEGIFPDNKILSHDIIEGAVLNTASGSVLYEDAPKSFTADRERLKRWARGDIQLLPFAGRGWKNAGGDYYRSEIHPIYKFLIARNFINLLFPVFALAVAVLSLVFPRVYILLLFLLFTPFVLDFFAVVRKTLRERIRLRYAMSDIGASLLNSLIEAGMLPYYALSNAFLIFTTLKRMITKGNLLEWKTYYHSQTSGGKFINETAVSMAAAPLTAFILYLAGLNFIPALIYAVFSYAVYLGVYLSGLKTVDKVTAGADIEEYARKTYAYFRYMRKPGALIADNLQIKPYKGMSDTTSPTNIGFQIISEISGYHLKFSGRAETLEVLEEILCDVERLEKWEGNLYNWYRVTDKKPAVRFVSSVDSGNFAAAMIILKEFFISIGENSLAKRSEKIIEETNIGALYDGAKKQFYLGYDVKDRRFEGHYDLLASESRLLSFIYIALTGDIAHWKALVRDFSPVYGNTLFSWSGTMFEYLLPEVFIKSAKGSLFDRSARNAVRVQIRRKVRGLFGRSESGYYAFDDDLRYQYKAFGVEELALGREKEKNIISPYSSFLALEYNPKACMDNLEKLNAMGACGDYGFYEAVDMEGRPRILRSYMTHHQGMIMAALSNFITGGELRELLINDARIDGARILLTEGQETRSFGKKIEERQIKVLEDERAYYRSVGNIEYSTAGAGLTDGILCSYFDAQGSGFTMYNGITINRFMKGSEERGSRHYYVLDGESVSSPTYITLKDNPQKYFFAYTPVSVTYLNGEDGVKLDIAVDGNLYAEVNKITVKEYEGKRLAFYEPLALNTYNAQNAHPAFNNMFIETEYLEDYNAIVAKRSAKKGERPVYAALVIRGLSNIKAESNRFNFIGRGRDEAEPRFFLNRNPVAVSFGDVLEPCFAFIGDLKGGCCEIIKIFADGYDDLLQKIKHIPEDYYGFSTEMGNNIVLNKLTNDLLYPLMSVPYLNRQLIEIDKQGGRDGFIFYCQGNKLLVYVVEDLTDLLPLQTFIAGVSQLRYFGLTPFVSVVLPENAGREAEGMVAEMFKKHFFNNYRLVIGNPPDGLMSSAYLILDKSLTLPERTFYLKRERERRPEVNFTVEGDYLFRSGQGGIIEEGYLLPLVKLPPLPHSNVVCGRRGGFIATEYGGGVIYFQNSHERRALRFDNDPVKDTPYERIALSINGNLYRINGGRGVTSNVLISRGFSRYDSAAEGIKAVTEAYIINDGGVKINEINLSGEGGIGLYYSFEAMLGNEASSPFVYSEKTSENTVKIKNLLTYQEVFIKVLGGELEPEIAAVNSSVIIKTGVRLKGSARIYIAAGLWRDIENLEADDIPERKRASITYFRELGNVIIKTPNPALDELFNNWLLYQVTSSRLNGKCGYYQLGGATGYRDQLQDCLALLHSDPKRVREQILRHAERQYKEGDVMHWWHEPRFGLRSKVSDDKLFLPFAVAEYVSATGDRSVLSEEIAYLESQPLAEYEHARYENAGLTDEKDTLHGHCLRAIKSSLKFGEHNLMLLGTGDWNDGLDYIGGKGKGESVALTMFAYWAITGYSELCESPVKEELKSIAERLRTAVENSAYDGKQYMRLFGDDGVWYGSYRSEKLTVDLISQSFAVLTGIAGPERAESALSEAQRLVDRENGIIKLLSPPLTKETYLGYISAYPKGVRENGGQYTHGAIWYIIALLRSGQKERAYELFDMINPLSRCRDRNRSAAYKGEPYVMPADIYFGQNAGRMGWSWYTGSAAWTYRMILEELFGIKRRGNLLYIEPNLPSSFDMSVMEYRSEFSTIKITFVRKGRRRLIAEDLPLDGKNYINLADRITSVTAEY